MDITGIGSVSDLAKDIIDKIWPDPAKQAEAKIALLQAQQAGLFKEMDAQLQSNLEQIKANAAAEAQPGFHFRDGAGWMFTIAFAIGFLKSPIEWGLAIAGHPLVLPSIDNSLASDGLFGLLGMGGMHLYQQVKS
jgi:Holin of 3TMs, for gene-transfer release